MTDQMPRYIQAVKPLKFEREESSCSLLDNDNCSRVETPSEALRAVTFEIVTFGVPDAHERLRLGAARMARRVLEQARSSGKGAGWVATVLSEGASLLAAPGLDDLTADRIAAFDALYLERTGREWGAA